MALAAGARLGAYEIVSALGVGGMGEVYRARDTKLGREVAIKVLPENVAADIDRIARFSREAQILASLNHPNIGSIFHLQEADGLSAFVARRRRNARRVHRARANSDRRSDPDCTADL